MTKYILFITYIIIYITICACTNEKETRRVLDLDGYTDINVTGYAWFMCGEHDFFHTAFAAKKNGKEVTGAVCSGLFFKGSTIRF